MEDKIYVINSNGMDVIYKEDVCLNFEDLRKEYIYYVYDLIKEKGPGDEWLVENCKDLIRLYEDDNYVFEYAKDVCCDEIRVYTRERNDER